MKIENEIKSKRIELVVVDSENDYYPSYRIQIGIKTDEFEGKFDRNIWLPEVDIDDFIERLSNFDKTRNGFEKLNSMSPDEFQLGFRNIDNLGHVSTQIQLRKESNIDNTYKDFLNIEFEIDPTSIRYIINGLKELKTQANQVDGPDS